MATVSLSNHSAVRVRREEREVSGEIEPTPRSAAPAENGRDKAEGEGGPSRNERSSAQARHPAPPSPVAFAVARMPPAARVRRPFPGSPAPDHAANATARRRRIVQVWPRPHPSRASRLSLPSICSATSWRTPGGCRLRGRRCQR
jgi:hypothetical protein